MSTNQFTTIYIVRHGESQGNVNYNAGITTKPSTFGSDLTELGKQQANLLAEELKNVNIDACYSSHLLRAKRTAEIIAAKKKFEVITDELLKERTRGTLNGQSEFELIKKFGHIYGDWESLPPDKIWRWKLFKDMESAEEAINRFIPALQKIVQKHTGNTILVVSHGNVMRTLLVYLDFGSFRELAHGTLDNTGYIVLELNGTDFTIKKTHRVNKNQISNEK